MPKLPKRYSPLGSPASGGFSHVFKCKDLHLDRDVAIKFIQDEDEKKRLLDELRALLQLRSKHVVQVYDIVRGEHDSIGIVEEFVEGEDLLQSEFPRLCAENYLKTLWQIASGIADIHAAGVIHRDIKPNNMKMDGEGIVKIFDFGLAKDEGVGARTLGFKGTLGFAAPELFGHSTVAFTPAIDTYAFAATALYLLFHKLPACLTACPPKPIDANYFSPGTSDIPAEIISLLNAALNHLPKARPHMAVIRDELARHLLRGKHQALGVHSGKPFTLNHTTKTAGLNLAGMGKIEISYDGLRFTISDTSGEVFVNNRSVSLGDEIPGSCVVAIGGPHRGNARVYTTFDVSNPEVVL